MASFIKLALAVVLVAVGSGCVVKIDTEKVAGIWGAKCDMQCAWAPMGYMKTEVRDGFKAYHQTPEMTADALMACLSYSKNAIAECVISPLRDLSGGALGGNCEVADQFVIPEGFTKVGTVGPLFVHLSPQPLDFESGKAYCLAQSGSHLVRVASAEENAAVADFVGDLSVVLGLNDIETEGVFVWQGPLKLAATYTNWNKGEPNNVRNEDCVAMKANKGHRWIDFQCSKVKFQALCQWERPN